jgi:nucleoside-diphosphate-sugar epimerase
VVTRRILVTGASGFVARALISGKRADAEYVAASRRDAGIEGVEWRRSPALSGSADWKGILEGFDAVVHLAGRVHLPAGEDASPYFVENCDGTLKLARDATAVGVQRFIFLSSAKVMGDESGVNPLAEDAPARPGDPYAASKLAAEQALAGLGGAMHVTVLRPPLVYGPGVKANFLALFSAVARGVPLPLAGIRNRRSLVCVDNLAAAIIACIESPAAVGRTYNVTDGAPVSTPELVRAIAAALGRPPRLFSIPPGLLEACGALLGRAEMVKRLTRSLELDDSAIRAELAWRPVCTFEAGIAQTARWYRSQAGKPG